MNTQQILRDFCVRELAGILSRCVEYVGDGDRQKTDWFTAARFVDSHTYILDPMIAGLASRIVAIQADIQAKSRELGDEITFKVELTFEIFRQLFGRWVWDSCYQVIQRGGLPRPPYGRIIFS